MEKKQSIHRRISSLKAKKDEKSKSSIHFSQTRCLFAAILRSHALRQGK